MKLARFFAATMVASCVLAAPGQAATLRWGAQNDILTLDPHSQNHATTHGLLQHTYESLVRERQQKDHSHDGLHRRQIRLEHMNNHRHRQETPAEQCVGEWAVQPARGCDMLVLGDSDSLHDGNCSTSPQCAKPGAHRPSSSLIMMRSRLA